jgi:proteic killer suppression protein
MTISFASKKLQKVCNSDKEMRAEFGAELSKKLQLRLSELRAADNLDEISKLPPARCHELSQNRQGQLAVDAVHPKRLIFRPNHTPVPTKADGGLDWGKVTSVIVLGISDYH